MTRKAQAALEFLSTYGWAILVILVMIGAISYFGIMNPSDVLPSRCATSSELACVDYRILDNAPNPSSVSLALKQGIGKTIYVERLNCTHGTASDSASFTVLGTSTPLSAGYAWSPQDTLEFVCDLSTLSGLSGTKAKVLFDVTYRQSADGFLHTATGEIYTEVQ